MQRNYVDEDVIFDSYPSDLGGPSSLALQLQAGHGAYPKFQDLSSFNQPLTAKDFNAPTLKRQQTLADAWGRAEPEPYEEFGFGAPGESRVTSEKDGETARNEFNDSPTSDLHTPLSPTYKRKKSSSDVSHERSSSPTPQSQKRRFSIFDRIKKLRGNRDRGPTSPVSPTSPPPPTSPSPPSQPTSPPPLNRRASQWIGKFKSTKPSHPQNDSASTPFNINNNKTEEQEPRPSSSNLRSMSDDVLVPSATIKGLQEKNNSDLLARVVTHEGSTRGKV